MQVMSALYRLEFPITYVGQNGFLASAAGVLLCMFAFYLGHSGLASFQIGALRMLGFDPPERYHYSFLATSPLDLWRRWNTYLGLWLQRYVFLPLALRWSRARGKSASGPAKAAALVATFAVCGLLHEHAGLVNHRFVALNAFLGFSFFGLAAVIWTEAVKRANRAWMGVGIAQYPLTVRYAGYGVSMLLQLHIAILFGWITLPALAGLGIPSFLARFLLP